MSTPTREYYSSNQTLEISIPEELQCLYTQSVCCRERAIKVDGERHTLCDYHRDKANAAQRRSAKKKRDENRRRRIIRSTPKRPRKRVTSSNRVHNTTNFHTLTHLGECDINIIDVWNPHSNFNFESTVFSEEDLNWLIEALASPVHD